MHSWYLDNHQHDQCPLWSQRSHGSVDRQRNDRWAELAPTTGATAEVHPATDSWAATSTTNAPSARDFHKAVWTGSEMIVWGGFA